MKKLQSHQVWQHDGGKKKKPSEEGSRAACEARDPARALEKWRKYGGGGRGGRRSLFFSSFSPPLQSPSLQLAPFLAKWARILHHSGRRPDDERRHMKAETPVASSFKDQKFLKPVLLLLGRHLQKTWMVASFDPSQRTSFSRSSHGRSLPPLHLLLLPSLLLLFLLFFFFR